MATVNPEEFKGNSIKQKEPVEKIPPEDIEVIAHGKTRKPSVGKRMHDVFISDAADTVLPFIVDEVVIPGIKDALLDILHGSVDRIFGSTSRGGYNSYRRKKKDREETSYDAYYGRGRGYYDDDDDYRRHKHSRRAQRSDRFDEVSGLSRAERDMVLDRMSDLIRRKGEVSVAQVKSMCDIHPISSTDSDWGWTDMRDISHYRDGHEYVIELGLPDEL